MIPHSKFFFYVISRTNCQYPFSKSFDEIDSLVDLRREIPEYDNNGLKMMVVNEKLITDNLLGIDFFYADDMLVMQNRGDSNKSIVLYYWKNLINNTDCPVSISLEHSSLYR